jgi:hypothetical protein
VSDLLVPGRTRYPVLMKWPFYFDWPVSTRVFRHCCAPLTEALDFRCDVHASPFQCGDYDFVFNEVFNETGIIHRAYEGTYMLLRHCPFCGRKKAPSARMRWEKQLTTMGFDLFGERFAKLNARKRSYTKTWRAMGVPEPYLSAAWRLQRGTAS